jgi:hypothetical protein
LELNLSGSQTLIVPEAFAGSFGVVLFYRGSRCPCCNTQLRAFQRAGKRLMETDTKVVALSADDEDTTAELIARLGLTFPVCHSADAAVISAATGADINPEKASTRPGTCSSASTPVEPSGDSYRTTFSAWSTTCIKGSRNVTGWQLPARAARPLKDLRAWGQLSRGATQFHARRQRTRST